MDLILNRIPREQADIFEDASTTWGFGGYCGTCFFLVTWGELGEAAGEFIARKELLACLLAVLLFGDLIKGKFTKIYTDNKNVFFWLLKGRSSNISGTKYLAQWELQKYLLECKISPRWIPSGENEIADRLSRGEIPNQLKQGGSRRYLSGEIKRWLSERFND